MRRSYLTGINFVHLHVNPVFLLFCLAMLCIALLQTSPSLRQSFDKTSIMQEGYHDMAIMSFCHVFGLSPYYTSSFRIQMRPIVCLPNSMCLIQLCLLLTSSIALWSLISQDQDIIRPQAKHRPKTALKSTMTHCRVFRRRKLPYHLVLRCRRRQGNRPDKIFGPSRAELLSVRREKR